MYVYVCKCTSAYSDDKRSESEKGESQLPFAFPCFILLTDLISKFPFRTIAVRGQKPEECTNMKVLSDALYADNILGNYAGLASVFRE